MANASKKGASAPATRKPRTAKAASNKATEAAPLVAPQAAAPEAPAPKAEVAKPKRAPAVVQNGVTRPRAGGKCAAVWELTEAGMTKNDDGVILPPITDVKAAAVEAGLNPTNVSIEYYRCRQFHGVRGRQPKAAQAEA